MLNHYEEQLNNSPLYLDMAANAFSGLGLHTIAWPLYQKANLLQPNIDTFSTNFAACSVLLGKVPQAKSIYTRLAKKYPQHQKNHYELSKLEPAIDDSHVGQMQTILNKTQSPSDKNIFMFYAIGKELEDLGRFKEAFEYYKKAGDAVLSVANYDVADDTRVIESVMKTCGFDWLSTGAPANSSLTSAKTPIFIVGLPRTGTTLVERILSSHSQVESADETFFMQMAIRHASGAGGIHELDESLIENAADQDINLIAQHYMASIEYRLAGNDMFIDKYPYNYLYIVLLQKPFPKLVLFTLNEIQWTRVLQCSNNHFSNLRIPSKI